MAESATELGEPPVLPSDSPAPQPNSTRVPVQNLTPEELLAKAIAPIKKQFLRPPPTRANQNDNVADTKDKTSQHSSTLVKEKKSKRQLKRERRQEKQSAGNLCPEVAKSGDVSSCPYKDKCRFSHDLEGFKAQKPDDLEGECPFLSAEGPCPYGLACRFSSTHRDVDACAINTLRKSSEVNGLNKDVQKLLWKNKMKFPKADAKLKSLGLLGPAKKLKVSEDKEEGDVVDSNNSHATDGNVCTKGSGESLDESEHRPCVPEENNVEVADDRPLKKAKSENVENCCSGQVDSGASVLEEDNGKNCAKTEPQFKIADMNPETDGSLKTHPREKKLIDFREKLYLAPLTTVGNLPFRRVCKSLSSQFVDLKIHPQRTQNHYSKSQDLFTSSINLLNQRSDLVPSLNLLLLGVQKKKSNLFSSYRSAVAVTFYPAERTQLRF